MIKNKDFIEALEIIFLQSSESKGEWTTMVSGKYAANWWRGKKVVALCTG
ncbi:MAG: hypothetical protein GY862_24105 [Gammaproteobacteria bacterium]|nr:hypothetical protein [Gammaproteobacteria bacterium]